VAEVIIWSGFFRICRASAAGGQAELPNQILLVGVTLRVRLSAIFFFRKRKKDAATNKRSDSRNTFENQLWN